MKIHSGKETLKQYKNLTLEVNFDELLEFNGERKFKDQVERQFARILFLIGTLILASSMWLIFSADSFSLENIINPNDIVYVLPGLSIYFFLYAAFLLRDKDEFDIELEDKNFINFVNKVGEKPAKLEINNYLSEDVLGIIDEAYFKDFESFLLCITEDLLHKKEIQDLLKLRLGINPDEFMELVINSHLNVSFDRIYNDLFLNCFASLQLNKLNEIDTEMFFLIILKHYLINIVNRFNIGDFELSGLEQWLKMQSDIKAYQKRWKLYSKLKPTGAINKAYTSRATKYLDLYGTDLTSISAKGDFEITLGKDQALKQMIEILEKESGSALLLIGDPGVGKTKLIKHLATKMVMEDVPHGLKDMRLVSINLNKVLAKSKSIDDFKNILQSMLEELVYSRNIVLVLEEIDEVFSLRSEGRLEVVNLISGMLDQHNLKILGTTNYENYGKRIKPIKGFSALFDIVEIHEPDNSISFQILMDEVPNLEKKYKIRIYTSAIKRIIDLGSKLPHERVMPDKGLELLEQSILRAKDNHIAFLDNKTVDEVLKDKFQINVGNISSEESESLQKLNQILKKRVIGQDLAVESVVAAIKRSRAGLSSGKRPIASFLFYGPTGVGKTQVAKTLSDVYYGSEKMMLRIDMSEFQEEANLNRLIGYSDSEGNFIGGILTESVRRKPFSLVLLDELDKANPRVLDLFLQVLDEGFLTDGLSRKVDFTNTIIIATSNAASKQIAELTLAGKSYKEIESETSGVLRNYYKVEFLNRFDKVIMFKALSRPEIEKIVEIFLAEINEKLVKEKHISIEWDIQTITELAKLGYNQVYGAREINRVVQDNILDKLASKIISNELKPGQKAIFEGLNIINII